MLPYQIIVDKDRLRLAQRDPALTEPSYVHHGRELWKSFPRFRMECPTTPALMTEIESRLSLAEYVGRYTTLAERGGFQRGPCPYCTGGDCEIIVIESPRRPPHYWTISASLTPQQSCAATGNIVGLQMRMRNIGYLHAIFDLCEDAEIPPPRFVLVG